MNIEHVSRFKYRILKEGKMRVDAEFYASEGILDDLKSEDYASLRQICNVAMLPGVVEPALSMPDIHWGYGFPIGGVAAFDPQEGGVVSPGGVGFDINCGVRLLVSDGEGGRGFAGAGAEEALEGFLGEADRLAESHRFQRGY